MSWTVLLALFSYFSCSVAQFTVIQDAEMSVSPGENTRLTCTRSGGSVTGDHYPAWYYQTPGNAPKLVVGSSGTSNQNYKPSTTSDRFTGSILGGSAVLSITQVQPEDDGDYYCCLYAGAGINIFGVGTQMDVLTGEVKPPTVSIYPPSEEELNTDNATLLCAITDFNPKTVTVEWHMDGVKQTNGVHISPLSKQSDHTYTKISFFTLPSSEYIKHEDYTCKVTHQGKDIVQTLKRSECA